MNIKSEMHYLAKQFFKKEFWNFTTIQKKDIDIFLVNIYISDKCLNVLFKNVCNMYHIDFVVSILELKKNQLTHDSFCCAKKLAMETQNIYLLSIISDNALSLL
jgi:hypothetical protein